MKREYNDDSIPSKTTHKSWTEPSFAIMTLNNDGTIIETNRTLTRILGFERAELNGRIINEIISMKDCDRFYCQYKVKREPQFKQVSKFEFRKKDGSGIDVLVESVCRNH